MPTSIRTGSRKASSIGRKYRASPRGAVRRRSRRILEPSPRVDGPRSDRRRGGPLGRRRQEDDDVLARLVALAKRGIQEAQVRQSFESSLEHPGVEHIDSYLLHGPRTRRGLSEADRQVWRAMEALHGEGRARLLGISNVSAEHVAALCEIAAVKPAFVQNRCFARHGWDREVRDVCRREGVVYQGFSLLTANHAELASRTMREIATRHGRTVPQVVFRFALQIGMICLTGTTDPEHMGDDLAAYDLVLAEQEVEAIERLSG